MEFNFSGESLRDAGIKKAVDHAESECPGWAGMAYKFFTEQFLPKHKRFMGEDVRAYAAILDFQLPPHARAWGGIIAKAAKEFLIIKIGLNSVKNPKAHCANATVWERNDERMIENGLLK